MISKENLGKIIQNLRNQKGLTQDELAEKIEISTNYLSKVERGLSVLNAQSFLKMAKVLKFSLNDFGIDCIDLNDTNENLAKEELIKIILASSQEEIEIYQKFIKLIKETIKK